MSVGHTPGPWTVRDEGKARVRIDGTDWWDLARVVTVVDGMTNPAGEANARLIAAAPDLLAACLAYDERVGDRDMGSAYLTDMIRAAIAKATQC